MFGPGSVQTNSSCFFCSKHFSARTLKKHNGYCGKCASALGFNHTISKSLKNHVWLQNIGKKYEGNCFVCNTIITYYNFECAHVVSKYAGGSTTLSNLKPTCSSCNKSCGTKNLYDFKNTLQPLSLNFNQDCIPMEIEPETKFLWD